MTAAASSSQLDLFGAAPAAPPPPPVPAAPAARIVAPPRPSPAAAFAGVDLSALAAIAGVQLLAEIEDDRIALEPAGWQAAMAERARLVQHQLAGTLTPGNAEALAALQRLQLAQVGQTPDGAIVTAHWALEHLHDALAGLRLAATENPDGT